MFNSKRSRAVRGMTAGKYFSPFYDKARRFTSLSPATVDAYLAAGGSATDQARRGDHPGSGRHARALRERGTAAPSSLT